MGSGRTGEEGGREIHEKFMVEDERDSRTDGSMGIMGNWKKERNLSS